VLVLDEPVNGLDPDGILWIRTLMRHLAGEGRTVFVSSHLMSEMAATADHLVVIGQGRLIAQCSTAEFIESSAQRSVLVRTVDVAALCEALLREGAKVSVGDDGGLDVQGPDAARIGEIAAANHVVLHELTPRQGSLEDAFIERTHGSRDFPGLMERSRR
jgi:ABC-2 type transport system ATP-binding protein